MIKDIFGKPITDIRCKFGMQDGWLETVECFFELENNFYIQIPYGYPHGIWIVEPDTEAESIFNDLSDIPIYHINKEEKSISEVIKLHNKRKQNIFNRLRKALFNYEPPIKEYKPYKVEYHENKLKYLINRTIVDYLWENDNTEKGIFELDNGYFITERYMAPHGTGAAGLHYYDSLNSLKEEKGENLKRYSELINGN